MVFYFINFGEKYYETIQKNSSYYAACDIVFVLKQPISHCTRRGISNGK